MTDPQAPGFEPTRSATTAPRATQYQYNGSDHSEYKNQRNQILDALIRRECGYQQPLTHDAELLVDVYSTVTLTVALWLHPRGRGGNRHVIEDAAPVDSNKSRGQSCQNGRSGRCHLYALKLCSRLESFEMK